MCVCLRVCVHPCVCGGGGHCICWAFPESQLVPRSARPGSACFLGLDAPQALQFAFELRLHQETTSCCISHQDSEDSIVLVEGLEFKSSLPRSHGRTLAPPFRLPSGIWGCADPMGQHPSPGLTQEAQHVEVEVGDSHNHRRGLALPLKPPSRAV